MTNMDMTDEQYRAGLHYADMRDRQLCKLRTRAAIRVARRLGADVEELHDVMIAMHRGWTPEVEKRDVGQKLLDECDDHWRDRGEPGAPPRTRKVCELLGEMWPDVIAECRREERDRD